MYETFKLHLPEYKNRLKNLGFLQIILTFLPVPILQQRTSILILSGEMHTTDSHLYFLYALLIMHLYFGMEFLFTLMVRSRHILRVETNPREFGVAVTDTGLVLNLPQSSIPKGYTIGYTDITKCRYSEWLLSEEKTTVVTLFLRKATKELPEAEVNFYMSKETSTALVNTLNSLDIVIDESRNRKLKPKRGIENPLLYVLNAIETTK